MDILHNDTVRSILRGPKGDDGAPGKIGLMGPPGNKGNISSFTECLLFLILKNLYFFLLIL
jgi:hypothetical protein